MSEASPRVIVVLGYADGGRDELHPIGAARLARAAEVSTASDVVVLSGWARVPGTRSEAELMAGAWRGHARELVVDPNARTTVGNAANALDDIRRAARARSSSSRRGGMRRARGRHFGSSSAVVACA